MPSGLWADHASAIARDMPVIENPQSSQIQSPSGRFVEVDISFSPGVRFDRLDWSTAGSAGSPNILSELSWTNLYSYQWVVAGSLTVGSHLYARGTAGYAAIQNGWVRDSDYDGDDRTFEYSRSISRTRDDNMWDLSCGAGTVFSLARNRLVLAPLIGYSIHHQNLRITDGRQVIATPPDTPPQGPLDDRLNSTFQADWQGPWVGVDLNYTTPAPFFNSTMTFALGLEYHFAVSYSAVADWNLRSDLAHPVSFRQNAQGNGLQIDGRWLIQIHRRINLNMGLTYQYWKTDPGAIYVYLRDGSRLETKLNAVEWQSTNIYFGVVYQF